MSMVYYGLNAHAYISTVSCMVMCCQSLFVRLSPSADGVGHIGLALSGAGRKISNEPLHSGAIFLFDKFYFQTKSSLVV